MARKMAIWLMAGAIAMAVIFTVAANAMGIPIWVLFVVNVLCGWGYGRGVARIAIDG